VDKAMPYGLALGELVTNAFLHAFPGGGRGHIQIGLTDNGAGEVTLEVADDGVGLPAGFDASLAKGFGLHLVRLLIEDQLDGQVTITSGPGMRVLCKTGGVL